MLFHFRQCKKKNRNTIYFEDKSKHSSHSYSFSLLHLGARRGSQMTVSPSRFSSSKCFSNLSNACGARVEIITQDFLQPHFTRWMVCVCACVWVIRLWSAMGNVAALKFIVFSNAFLVRDFALCGPRPRRVKCLIKRRVSAVIEIAWHTNTLSLWRYY